MRPAMRGLPSVPRSVLRVLAVALAAATLLYSVLWMYYIRREPQALLGVEYDETPATGALRVTRVTGGSGAERSGVRPGDLLREVNGRLLACGGRSRAR